MYELQEFSMGLGIAYYSNQAYQGVASLLHQVERFGIGYTRDFFRDPKAMIKTLTTNARESKAGYDVVSLGYLGGNYAVIKPTSQAQFMELMNYFDQEEVSRKGHESFRFFSGSDFFIIAGTGENNIGLRKNLSRFLIPARLAQPMNTEIETRMDSDANFQLRHRVIDIVRAVILDNILGVKQLPEQTYDVMAAYRNDVKRWGAFPFPELMNFIPSLRKKREAYRTFNQSILEPEFEKLVEALHTADSRNFNLITVSVIKVFKDENNLSEAEAISALQSLPAEEIRKYFDHPVVQSLPMILKATDNLTDAIVLCLEQIAADPNKLAMLRNEIDQLDGPLDIGTLKSLPVLNAFYKEAMRFDAPVAVPRYTKKGYSSDTMTIPPHSMILFDLQHLTRGDDYWTNPHQFDPKRFLPQAQPSQAVQETKGEAVEKNNHNLNQFPLLPFSIGVRNCPAFSVTEVLFKVAIAKFVKGYELELVEKGENDSTFHASPRGQSFPLAQ